MLSRIDLIGRLVRDPEYRALDDGTSVCHFTVAVDDDYKDKNGEKVTDFIDCTAWRKTAEFVTRFMSKGMLIAVTGRLKSRKWVDKEGNNRKEWYVKCDNVYPCDSKKDGNGASASGQVTVGNQSNPYSETEAMIAKYAKQVPTDDYAMLTDDDAQLPF